MYGSGWGMGWMWFVWPLLILGVILLMMLLARGVGGGANADGGSPPSMRSSGRTRAQEILDERYARGELSEEGYRDRLRHLGGEPDQ